MATTPYDPESVRPLAVSESGFVFDPRTGHSYSVNATGLVVLAGMKEGLDPGAIADRLRAAFDGGEAAEDDVEAFFAVLRDQGLAGRGQP